MASLNGQLDSLGVSPSCLPVVMSEEYLPDRYLMSEWEWPVYVGSAIPEQMGLGCIRKVAEQARGRSILHGLPA